METKFLAYVCLSAGLMAGWTGQDNLLRTATAGLFGVSVLATSIWHAAYATVPEPVTMGAVGFAALLANFASFALLWVYRSGDSNCDPSGDQLQGVHDLFPEIAELIEHSVHRRMLLTIQWAEFFASPDDLEGHPVVNMIVVN
jgi:hypothetical protein